MRKTQRGLEKVLWDKVHPFALGLTRALGVRASPLAEQEVKTEMSASGERNFKTRVVSKTKLGRSHGRASNSLQTQESKHPSGSVTHALHTCLSHGAERHGLSPRTLRMRQSGPDAGTRGSLTARRACPQPLLPQIIPHHGLLNQFSL